MLKKLRAVGDGLKLFLEQSVDLAIQEMFHNSRKHNCYVWNIFAFA